MPELIAIKGGTPEEYMIDRRQLLASTAALAVAGHAPLALAAGKPPIKVGSILAMTGIGAVYGLAKRKGFTTIGIVSSRARANAVAFSPCVDHVFVVKDATWGGRLPGLRELSPTSRAIVESSTAVVAIGGGEVARDEVLAAREAGKLVLFMPADMNHANARRKARQQGKPLPRDFRGAVHQALRADPPHPATVP